MTNMYDRIFAAAFANFLGKLGYTDDSQISSADARRAADWATKVANAYMHNIGSRW